MTTTVEQELQEYFTQLSTAEQTSILQLIKTIVTEKSQKQEYVSMEEYNKELDEAEAEFERGEYISHEEMRKQMKQW